MAKVLFVNVPYAGHIFPTLGLVEALIQAGHEVGYICTQEWRSKIEASGAKFLPYINYDYAKGSLKSVTKLYFAGYCAGLMYGREYDVLIYEEDFFVGRTLAKQLGIPDIRFFACPAYSEEVMECYHKLPFVHKHNVLKKFDHIVTNKLIPGIELKEKKRLDESERNIPDLNLVYTSKSYQPFSECLDDRFHYLGASIYEHRLEEEKIIITDTTKPIIYISMGSVFIANTKFYRNCIKAFGHCSVEVYMVIPSEINRKRWGEIPPNIHIYDSLPQLEILKKASLFITHGGMNSVNEAICYKVPMIVYPQGADQTLNAWRVNDLGIGVWLKGRNASPKTIYDMSMSVMENKEIELEMNHMNEEQKAAGGNTHAVELIETYINIDRLERRE